MAIVPALSDALSHAIAAEADLYDDPDGLARQVIELAHRFTKGRSNPTTSYLRDPSLAQAYAAYYLPLNIAKVETLLDELPLEWTQAPAGRLEILDVAAGPGSGALAVLDWMARRGHAAGGRVTAVDREAQALALCRRLWEGLQGARAAGGWTLDTHVGDLERDSVTRALVPARYDLIIVANALDELFRDARDPIERRTGLVRQLLRALAPSGTLMLMEPALRDTSRALHAVRDRLLEEGACGVFSPCLHERPCPALTKETDWCHEERPWRAPDFVQAIDRRVGFIKDALKFSYVLLRTDGRTVVPRSADLYRVVSERRELKGETRAWLCHETGRPEIGRLDRQRSAANQAFDTVHRGAIIRIDEIVRGRRKGRDSTVARITPETSVEIVRSV